ncbi:MAG TPA: winged helix-turn-helix domain-containing protein [Pyrinomonadaceae bacterium]
MIEEGRARSLYEFGPFVVDEGRRRLLRGGETVPLTKKEFETLLVLVRGGGRVVEKGELMEAVWPDAHVEEGNLAVHVSKLRGKLGRREDGEPYIETETGRGYRFTARVREVEDFDLVVRKRTRTHTVTEEEETDGPAAGAQAPSLPAANAPAGHRLTWRGALVVASAVAVAVAASAYFLQRRAAGRADAPADIRTLAVLPFALLDAGERDEYLGLGMADALITRLSNVRQIVVRPTSAVRGFAGPGRDAADAGRRLGVEAVLEGSIQKSGDRLRVTAQLVRTADGASLWAGTFDEPLTNVFAVQDAISEQLAAALALELTSDERARLTRRYTENADAYQLYVKGRYYWSKRDFDGVTRAESLFRQAIERDPNFAPAYVGLADMLAMGGPHHEIDVLQAKALELAPDLAEAYASLGFTAMFHRWDWAGAERELHRAIELNPGYGTAHQWLATLLAITGRTEEAKAAMRRALEVDPQSPNFLADMAQMHYFAREYAEAESYSRRALEVAPDFVFAHLYLTYIYLKTGRHAEALEEWCLTDRAAAPTKYDAAAAERQRREVLERHRREGFIGFLRELTRDMPRDAHEAHDASLQYQLALYHAALGDRERALHWLEKAVAGRAFLAVFFRADPVFDDLHAEPRYQALLRQANLPARP